MQINDYQKAARLTSIYPMPIVYPALGLAGESGEVCEKVKKIFRDDDGLVTDLKREEIRKELGDVLWYIANIASDLNLELNDIAQANIDKLLSRQKRGTLGGSGDNR